MGLLSSRSPQEAAWCAAGRRWSQTTSRFAFRRAATRQGGLAAEISFAADLLFSLLLKCGVVVCCSAPYQPSCTHGILQAAGQVDPLGSSDSFSVEVDAIAGAIFDFELNLLDDPGCFDIGRADGNADAYCDTNR